MQRSWLQWVAAGDQWYLSKLGMECCLIYQGEPALTWVGMPGDILFLFCLKLLWSTGHEQLKPESHKAYIQKAASWGWSWDLELPCMWQTVLLYITTVLGSVLLQRHAPGKTASAGETWGSLLHLSEDSKGNKQETKEWKEWAFKRSCLFHGFGNVSQESYCHPSVTPPCWGMRAE